MSAKKEVLRNLRIRTFLLVERNFTFLKIFRKKNLYLRACV